MLSGLAQIALVLTLLFAAMPACVTPTSEPANAEAPVEFASLDAPVAPKDEPSFLNEVAARTLAEGGATADVNARSLVGRRDAFAVSRSGGSEIPGDLDVPKLSAELQTFVAKHGDALKHPESFLGTWKSPDGKIYLDVTVLIPYRTGDRDEVLTKALELARKEGQRSIYDLGRGTDISVP